MHATIAEGPRLDFLNEINREAEHIIKRSVMKSSPPKQRREVKVAPLTSSYVSDNSSMPPLPKKK